MRAATALAFLLIATWAQAECYYSNYALTLEVTTTANEKLTCYRTVSSCDVMLDSMSNNAYLLRVLFDTSRTDDMAWYSHRATFRYCMEEKVTCAESEKESIHYLFNAFHLARANVSRIRVVDHELVSALDGISSDLQLADTVLFHRSPIEVIACGGYLCYHRVAVYTESAQSHTAITAIKALNVEMAEQEIDSDNGDDYDARMWQWVDQLIGLEGLIIVSGCTD